MTTNNAVNEPTAASGTVLQGQGVGTTSAFSTATYPATTTINQILYSSAANTVTGLATANSAVLATNGSGVPSITATPTVTSITFGSGTALSVYQEGTWTPTLAGGSVAGSTSYTTQTGNYTRIGRLVVATFVLVIASATGTGDAVLGGLPFTAGAASSNTGSALWMSGAGWTWPAGTTYATVETLSGTTTGAFVMSGSATVGSNLQMTNAAYTWRGTIVYFV